MSLFTNQNFINQIAKQSGVPNLQEDVAAILQVLVQIQTRRLIQEAGKFMKNDCRDQIDFQDIQNALGNLNHNDLVLLSQQENYARDGSSYLRRDPVYTSAKNFVEQELKSLTLNSFAHPKLRARWIYLDGKIPRINENNMLKTKSEIISIRQKELDEKHKKFNIIMDQPESMLTGQQLEYFKYTTQMLSQESENVGKLKKIDLEGNLSNLFPLFLKFFVGTNLTQLKMVYFLELLKNRYIEKSAEFHLHQILTYLWAYQGQHCLQVGLRIGSYIKNLGQKYPMLYNLWSQPTDKIIFSNPQIRRTAYCNAIKKIGIELEVGIEIQISTQLLDWVEKDFDSKVNLKVCQKFKEIIYEYSGRITCLRKHILAFWVPTMENSSDPFMMMNL